MSSIGRPSDGSRTIGLLLISAFPGYECRPRQVVRASLQSADDFPREGEFFLQLRVQWFAVCDALGGVSQGPTQPGEDGYAFLQYRQLVDCERRAGCDVGADEGGQVRRRFHSAACGPLIDSLPVSRA
jgi:hypothetical protein